MSAYDDAARLAAGVGSRNEQTKRHNLSTILTMVHHEGSLSRAELTRLTGLNRSTIGALVGELVELGLVTEQAAPESGTVGRPSPLVVPNSSTVAIVVAPDIDAVVLGVVGLGAVVHERRRYEVDAIPTAAEATQIISDLVDDLREDLEAKFRVVGVGLAIPGLVRVADGSVAHAPNLGWTDEPLSAMVAKAVGYPVAAGNDANVGVIAEVIFGAGRALRDLVYLNGLPSGIGGGVLVNGTPLRGFKGYGAELGHLLVNTNGDLCHCGRVGCLETEVSLSRLQEAAGLESLAVHEVDQVLARADEGALAAEVDRQVDVLGVALADLMVVFNPEVIVLGGFLGALLTARTERLTTMSTRASFKPLAEDVRIVRSDVHESMVMVGAAELAFGPLLSDPASLR